MLHVAVDVQAVIREQMLHQHSSGVEPDFGPRVVRIGVIVVVGAGVQDVGGSGPQAHLVIVEISISVAAGHIFEYVVVSVGAHNMIIGIRIGDARGKRGKFLGDRSQAEIMLFSCCSVNILHDQRFPSVFLC